MTTMMIITRAISTPMTDPATAPVEEKSTHYLIIRWYIVILLIIFRWFIFCEDPEGTLIMFLGPYRINGFKHGFTDQTIKNADRRMHFLEIQNHCLKNKNK